MPCHRPGYFESEAVRRMCKHAYPEHARILDVCTYVYKPVWQKDRFEINRLVNAWDLNLPTWVQTPPSAPDMLFKLNYEVPRTRYHKWNNSFCFDFCIGTYSPQVLNLYLLRWRANEWYVLWQYTWVSVLERTSTTTIGKTRNARPKTRRWLANLPMVVIWMSIA